MENGWIKLHGKIREWRWWGDHATMCVWIHILIGANWKEKQWKNITVPRGSMVTSREILAAECGLSPMQVRRALDNLQSTGEIAREITNRYTVIKVCKYESYQLVESDGQPSNNQQTTNKQPTNNQQTTTTEEYKNTRTTDIKKKPAKAGKKESADNSNSDERHLKFQEYMRQFFPTVQEMKQPLTMEQYNSAAKKYGRQDVDMTLGQMENMNNPPVAKKYKSANLTLLNWIRRERERKGMTPDPTHPGVRLGPGERWENGRRTYGDGKYTVPPDAPPRPSENHYWAVPEEYRGDDPDSVREWRYIAV